MDDEDILFATGYLKLKRFKGNKREEKFRFNQIYKQRNESGIYHNLVLEIALGDRELYFKQVPDKLLPCICVNCIFFMYGLHLSLFYRYIRMSPESFKYLQKADSPITSKEDKRF